METLLSVAVGLGLSAACGFRVFAPLLGLSIASLTGHLPLGEDFSWLGTLPAALTLGTATLVEIAAYYIPWVDNALDTIATPMALVAGMVATGAVVTDLPPLLKWAVALIGGGGAAGLVQGATVLLRLKSGAATGGLANPVVATVELVGAVATVVLALVVPLLALALVIAMIVWIAKRAGRLVFGRSARREVAAGASDRAQRMP